MMFSSQSPFDKLLEKATSSDLLEIDWDSIISICDLIAQEEVQPKYALNAIKKKIYCYDPHVSLYALELLDACVSNCGKNFHLEVCSREFENDIKKILYSKNSHPKVIEKLKEYLRRWSEQEFKNNPQLSLIPALYNKLKQEGMQFNSVEPKKKNSIKLSDDPNVVSSNQEEEDIAKAIELSLKESTSPKNYSKQINPVSLYPKINNSDSFNNYSVNLFDNNQSSKSSYKVRAIYDFEAAEDNEITFKAGDIITVSDDSDLNWWKGWNNKQEGLFPSNFVTKNLEEEKSESILKNGENGEKKSVQFNEEVRVKLLNTKDKVTEIDESKIDKLLYLLHEADPTGERSDSEELIQLEDQCAQMAPLIDQEIEKIDKLHASLSTINNQLVDALNVYCSLIKENSTYPSVNQCYMQPMQLAQMQANFNNMYLGNYNEHLANNMVGPTANSNVSNTSLPLQSQMSFPLNTNYPANSYSSIYSRPALNVGPTSTAYHYGDLGSNHQMLTYPTQQHPQIHTSAIQQIPATSLQSHVLGTDEQSLQNAQTQNQLNQIQYVQQQIVSMPTTTHQSS